MVEIGWPGPSSAAAGTMVVGILQVEIRIDDATSLKDKRRVLTSLKDRLHRQYQVAVAEVDLQEALRSAVLGIAAVSNSARYTQGMLDRILQQIRDDRRLVLTDHQTEIIAGR
ncbi:MAG: DUF503 domain-containing protein [Phycisphaerae bacterium]|nr:DUF503 domain-containing protein [Phycisphaerae bacterium]